MTNMTTAYYSAVLDHPLETVWSLICDFNNYPAYIDGVTESVIEDDKRGDEIGAIRRFCYLGNWIRQRLADHSDEQHSLTYAGVEPFPFPSGLMSEPPEPVRYEGTHPAIIVGKESRKANAVLAPNQNIENNPMQSSMVSLAWIL
jgi:hypothetical protein